MTDKAVFYVLRQKFLDTKKEVSEPAQNVMYYSLNIGHHVGVIDCLNTLLEWPIDAYRAFCERLSPQNARDKMAGLLRWGEITIDPTHVDLLYPAISSTLNAPPALDAEDQTRAQTLLQSLQDMAREPALYLIVKRRNDL